MATLSVNYYLDLMTVMPSGCFYFYHGNDMMFFKFDFYVKLPTFTFINFDVSCLKRLDICIIFFLFQPVPVVLKQAYAILTWQFVIKKSSRYVIYGYCFPGQTRQSVPIYLRFIQFLSQTCQPRQILRNGLSATNGTTNTKMFKKNYHASVSIIITFNLPSTNFAINKGVNF